MRTWVVRALAVAALGWLATSTSVQAQNTITLEGNVSGKEGEPIAGAQIVVTNIATSERRNLTTRQNGEFVVLGLYSGKYAIDVRALGYKPVQDSVQLVIGQRARLTIVMEKGATELQAVAVTADRVKQVEV